jgi:hypothetical protein
MRQERYDSQWALFSFLLVACSCSFPAGDRTSNGPTEHQYGDRIEEPGLVPAHFAESSTWNDESICPEGAFLSSFAKYIDRSPKDSSPIAIRYGRECVKRSGVAAPGRAPASNEGSAVAPMIETPHGPFIWWNAEGKVTRSGAYGEGVLVRWETKTP